MLAIVEYSPLGDNGSAILCRRQLSYSRRVLVEHFAYMLLDQGDLWFMLGIFVKEYIHACINFKDQHVTIRLQVAVDAIVLELQSPGDFVNDRFDDRHDLTVK